MPREHKSCILPGGSHGQKGEDPAHLQAVLLCIVQQDQPHQVPAESPQLCCTLHTHTHAIASHILTCFSCQHFQVILSDFVPLLLLMAFSLCRNQQFLQSQNKNISQAREHQIHFYIQNALCPAEWKQWGCIWFFHKQWVFFNSIFNNEGYVSSFPVNVNFMGLPWFLEYDA